MNLEDLETASMEDMVDFFNANSKKKVKGFADRPTAIKRCTAVIEKLAAKPDPEPVRDLTEEELLAKAEASKARRQAGTKASWTNEETRAKRIARHGVEVDGVYYKSVGDAYRKLGLPLNKRISHRIELKQKGEDYEYFRNGVDDSDGQFHWKIVPYRKVEPKPKAPKAAPETGIEPEAAADEVLNEPVEVA